MVSFAQTGSAKLTGEVFRVKVTPRTQTVSILVNGKSVYVRNVDAVTIVRSGSRSANV